MIKLLLKHLLSNIEIIYQDIDIEFFQEVYFQTARFCRVWEQLTKILFFIVKDDQENEQVIIYSRFVFIDTNYEKEISRSMVCEHSVPYSWMEESYRVSMEVLEWEDKLILFKFLTDSFTIKKPKMLEKKDSMREEEEDQESEKLTYVLRSSNTTVVAHRTIYIKIRYQYPVVLRVIAQIGVPLGLSVMLFSDEQCLEIPLMFLIIHPRRI